MYLASEDTEELQNQIVKMTEQFTYFDESTKEFKVFPNAKRDLREIAKETGIAYDETPISNEFRTARIPGTDRKWVSIGASYIVSDEFIVDGAYTHMFMSDPTINEADSNGYVLAGKYDSGVDMVGLQLRWLMP
jgi:hypothetical protein